jgi:hypothetical protein
MIILLIFDVFPSLNPLLQHIFCILCITEMHLCGFIYSRLSVEMIQLLEKQGVVYPHRYYPGTPTKRQVSKRQVSKRQVSKRPVSKRQKRQVYKTSAL